METNKSEILFHGKNSWIQKIENLPPIDEFQKEQCYFEIRTSAPKNIKLSELLIENEDEAIKKIKELFSSGKKIVIIPVD